MFPERVSVAPEFSGIGNIPGLVLLDEDRDKLRLYPANRYERVGKLFCNTAFLVL